VVVLESDNDAGGSNGSNDAARDNTIDIRESGLFQLVYRALCDIHVCCSLNIMSFVYSWILLLTFTLNFKRHSIYIETC